jgi:CBS domain-containing protein
MIATAQLSLDAQRSCLMLMCQHLARFLAAHRHNSTDDGRDRAILEWQRADLRLRRCPNAFCIGLGEEQLVMKVSDLMTTEVRACHPYDLLNRAAQIMWENDCGAVPVVDSDSKVIGMLTDRDICMAAYTKGIALVDGSVASVMSRDVCVCKLSDNISAAAEKMRERQIRRLPVIDGDKRLVGILSVSDIARETERLRAAKSRKRPIKEGEFVETLSAICSSNGNGASHAA